MSDDKDNVLSPEEIDALLKDLNNQPAEKPSSQPVRAASKPGELSSTEIDAIGEIGNISMGAAATALSKVLHHKVDITTPRVALTSQEGLRTGSPRYCIVVNVEYIKGLNGVNVFLLKPRDAAIIGDLMMGGDGSKVKDELDEVGLSAVAECMNQMMGSAATAVASLLSQRIEISPPVTKLIDLEKDPKAFDVLGFQDPLIQVAFDMSVEDLVQSEFFQVIPFDFAKQMIEGVYRNTVGGAEVAAAAAAPAAIAPTPAPMVAVPSSAAMGGGVAPIRGTVPIQSAQFVHLNSQPVLSQPENLNLLMDVTLPVTVELGRSKMMIKDILDLGKGSLIELEKFAGEPVDILVNGKRIARGEVVVIDENFGVKIVDILSPVERMNGLQ